MDFKHQIAKQIAELTELEFEKVLTSVEIPPNPEMGDLAFPCFPLAKVMRYELKKRGINKLKVVYSKEKPLTPLATDEISGKRQTPGSIS